MKYQGAINKLLTEMKSRGGMTHTEMKNFLVQNSNWADPKRFPRCFNSEGNYKNPFYEAGLKMAKLFCDKVPVQNGIKITGFKYVVKSDIDPTTVKPFGKATIMLLPPKRKRFHI